MSSRVLLIAAPARPFRPAAGTVREAVSEYIPQPLGLCYLAAVLRNAGHQVEIYDPHVECYRAGQAEVDPDELRAKITAQIAQTSCDVLGISSPYIYTYEWAHYIADRAKDRRPQVPVVIGGGYPSLLPEHALQNPHIDYAVTGEGEAAFRQLLAALSGREARSPADIEGVAYREGGRVIARPRRAFVEDVDALPFPAWDLAPVERYMEFAGKRSLIVITSRGCPYRCTFCNSYETWGRRFRPRSPASVLAEVDYLIERFAVDDILFVDDNMTVDKARFLEIAAGLARRRITWSAVNISSFTTDEEMLRAMKASGCDRICIAVESAVPRTLRAIRKPVDLERTREIVRLCRRLGLQCRLCYITGLPSDTQADMLETFRYSEEVRGDWNQYSILIPYPGTDIYRQCCARGYFVERDLDLAQFTQRRGFLQTENWDREWVATVTYDYNIKTNFLRNYNLLEPDGNLDTALEHFAHVVRFAPGHVIALICLAYACEKKGHAQQCRERLAQASALLQSPDAQRTFGKYLEWDEEVIRFYRRWTATPERNPQPCSCQTAPTT